MRIELPSANWDPAALRADEDAHTLTMAPQPAVDWLQLPPWELDPGVPLHARVPDTEPASITITF